MMACPLFKVPISLSGFTLACLLIWTPHTWGEAFRILDQSASATGQGTAFAAQADDPSAIHFNPAGMTQLEGIQTSFGTNFVSADISLKTSSGSTTHGSFGGTIAIPPPSNFYVTANLKSLGMPSLHFWTVGLGVTTPFGISIEYPKGSPISPVVTRTELPLIDIKPTLAIKANDYISVGIGLDIYTFSGLVGEGQAELHFTGGPELGPGLSGQQLELNGTDTAVGYNLSLLLTPVRNRQGRPLVNLAFVYRNQVTLNLKGDFLVNGLAQDKARATLALPQIVSAGVAIWPIRDPHREWKVEIDVDYADWNDNQNLNVQLASGLSLPPEYSVRQYSQAYILMIGNEYKWLGLPSLPYWDIALRGGYVFSHTPIPDFSFDASVPDSNYHAFSLGLGFLCNEQGTFLGMISCNDWLGTSGIGLDLAYQVLLYQERTINSHVRSTQGFPTPSTWDNTVHVGSINLRINFSS